MNITPNFRSGAAAQVSRPAAKVRTAQTPAASESQGPQETFTRGETGLKRVVGEIAPYALAGLGVAAGIAVAVASGGVALATGGIALGAAGAAVGTLAGGLSGMGPVDQQISPVAGAVGFGLVSAAIGVGAAALPGVVGGIIGGVLVGGVTAAVGYLGGGLLRSQARGEF